MAKWLLPVLAVTLLPMVVCISHPELRRVLGQDFRLLFAGEAPLYVLTDDSPQRKAILRLEELGGEESRWQRVREYARMARQTRQPYLYAAALRTGIVSSIDLRVMAVNPPPELVEQRRAMTQQVLSLSQEMIALDADNAFPHLLRTYALFALGHEEKAVQSLRAAAACPRYVDYDTAWVGVVAPPQLTAEERALITALLPLPHLLRFRDTMKSVLSLAERLESKGDHARALALREAVASVGAKMRDAPGALVTSLVGVSIQRLAWSRGEEKGSREEEANLLTLASRFAAYARQHGRPDLVQKTLAEAAVSQRFSQQIRDYFEREDALELGWAALHSRVIGTRIAGWVLLLWSSAMAFLLGTCLVLSPLWRGAEVRQDYIAPVATSLLVSGVFVAVAAGGVFALDGFGNLWESRIGHIFLDEKLPYALLTEENWQLLNATAGAVMTFLAVVCFTGPLVQIGRATGTLWAAWLVALGALLGLALVGVGEIEGFADIVLVALAGAIMLGGLAALVALPFYAFMRRKPLPVPLKAAVPALWGLSSAVAWTKMLLPTALWLAAGVVIWLLWSRTLRDDARAAARRAVHRFAMSALILSIFGLWLYAMLGCISLPIRIQQHAWLNQMIEHGERSLMEQTRL